MNDPSIQLYVVIAVMALVVRGDNVTEKYVPMGGKSSNKFQSRQHRLLSFTTDTEGEISIEIQFSVPFIRIPIDKALDVGKGAVANFNIAAILVSGVIVLVTGFIVPAIVKLIDQKMKPAPLQPDAGRDVKNENIEWWRILTLMDQALIENNIDTTSCMQRAVCWAIKASSHRMSNGQATTQDRIIDGLVSNEWIYGVLSGTPIQAAIKHGMGRINCSNKYSACKVTQKSLGDFVKQFTNAINFT